MPCIGELRVQIPSATLERRSSARGDVEDEKDRLGKLIRTLQFDAKSRVHPGTPGMGSMLAAGLATHRMDRTAAACLLATYFASVGGTEGVGSEGRSFRSFFSSFLAFFSMSLFRFSN
jgi:hypothetical protein